MKHDRKRKSQDDRLLKQLSLMERRQQEQLRALIQKEALFLKV